MGSDTIFSACANIICFSKENLDYFKRRIRHRNTHLIFMPHRVPELTKDVRIQKLRKHIGIEESAFLILRIVEVGRYYEKSTRVSCALLTL